jgi:hypothetical protein
MAVDQELSEQSGSATEHAGRNNAVKAVAAAAATGAAAYAAKKALSGRSESNEGSSDGPRSSSKGEGSVVGSMVSGGWDAARDALIPAAENAASAVGTYLAQNGPEVIRDRIVPRFISAFNKAQEGS